jgi:hypothetical protein
MGLFDGIGSLFGFGSQSTSNQGGGNTVTTAQLPSYLEDPIKRMLTRTEDASKLALPTYGAPRIADFSPDELQAFQIARGSAGIAPGIAMEGRDYVNQSTQDLTQDDINRYYNPYQDTVTARQLDHLGRQRQQQQQADYGLAGRVGAFGGSRMAVADKLRDDNFNRLEQDVVANQAQAGWNQALGQFNTQRGRQATAGASMAKDIAPGYAGVRGLDMTGLLTTGGMQTGKAQSNLDIAHGDFLEQRDWPYQSIDFLKSTLQGTPYSKTTVGNSNTQSTQSQPGANPMTSLLGLGLGIAGLF